MWTIGDVFSDAWRDFQEHWVVLAVAFLLMFVITQVINFGFPLGFGILAAATATQEIAQIGNCFAQLFSFVVQTMLNLGWIYISVQVARGNKPDFGDLFSQGQFVLPALVAQFLLFLIGAFLGGVPVAIGAGIGAVAGGEEGLVIGIVAALLVVIPAVLVFSVRMMFVLYLIVDGKRVELVSRPSRAESSGRRAAAGNRRAIRLIKASTDERGSLRRRR